MPGGTFLFDFEDAAIATVAPAHFDHRHKRVGMRLVETGDAEQAHMADLLVGFAGGRILGVALEAILGVGRLA